MPRPSPTESVEKILDEHAIDRTFEERHPARSGNICRCGTKHPFHDFGSFPTHNGHLAALIDRQFDSQSTAAIERLLDAHDLLGDSVQPVTRREIATCRCGTRHPPYDDGRFPTHRRHLATLVATLLVGPPGIDY